MSLEPNERVYVSPYRNLGLTADMVGKYDKDRPASVRNPFPYNLNGLKFGADGWAIVSSDTDSTFSGKITKSKAMVIEFGKKGDSETEIIIKVWNAPNTDELCQFVHQIPNADVEDVYKAWEERVADFNERSHIFVSV